MLILDATTKKIEVLLSGAVTTNQLPVVASYVDLTSTTFLAGASQTATNNTTAVTAVAAPAASTQRQVKELMVQNADTVSATVTVRLNDNTTTRTLVKVTLAANSTLQYRDHDGWAVIDSAGGILSSSAAGANPFADNSALVKNNSDNSKLLILSAASVTTGTTRTLTAQDSNYTLAGTTVALGGTGVATLASNGILYGNGTSAIQALAVNSSATNKFLTQSSSAAPAWATIATADVPSAALTKTDDTNVTLTLGGTPASALLAAASLTLGWTGTLAVTRGGSGAGTFTANGVMLGNGTSALAVTAAGTNNQVLAGNTSAAPAFRALTYADMPVTTLNTFTPLDNMPPASNYALLGNRNNHATLEFDNSTNWDAIFTDVLSRAYAGGNVVIALAWAAVSGTTGNVGWKGQFERLNANNHNLDTDAFATAQSSSADACNGTNGKLTVSTITFTSSQIDSVVAGDAFRLKITRDTTVSSNLAAKAQLVSVELRG